MNCTQIRMGYENGAGKKIVCRSKLKLGKFLEVIVNVNDL